MNKLKDSFNLVVTSCKTSRNESDTRMNFMIYSIDIETIIIDNPEFQMYHFRNY